MTHGGGGVTYADIYTTNMLPDKRLPRNSRKKSAYLGNLATEKFDLNGLRGPAVRLVR